MSRPLTLLLFALAACRKPAAPVVDAAPAVPDARPARELIRVQQISVEVQAWPPEAGAALDDHALAGRVWEGLSQSADFEAVGRRALPDAGVPVHRRRARVKAVYGVEVAPAAGKQPGQMRAAATLTVEWADDEDGPELYESVACEGDLPADRKLAPSVAVRLVECVIERGAHGLVDKEKIRRGDLAAVLAALDDPDPSMRQVAFAAIAERRMVAAVPRLLELLASNDVLERDGAIGALVALREPRAIKPLTELGQFKDLDVMRRVIDAIGEIGGDDARAYLELVASGHSVPAIRELAQQALDRMTRRAAAPDAR